MTQSRPALNALVQILLPGRDHGLASRVEDVSAEYVELAAPLLGSGFKAEPGREMSLVWRDGTGLHRMPAQLVEVRKTPHPVWRVVSVAEAEKFQRRRYARAETLLDVEIVFVGRDPLVQVMISAVDISEGGLRARTNENIKPIDGEMVEVRFEINGTALMAPGSILRHEREKTVLEFVVVLIEPVPDVVADAFRREVFRAQRRQRRNQLASER